MKPHMLHRKKAGTLILFLAIGMTCYSQRFEAYAITGLTFSQIDGDNLAGYNNFGVMVGGATNFILSNDFSFQQEIVYYQRGSRATEKELSNDVFTKKDLHYIDLIALINKTFNNKWLIQTGVGVGKLLWIGGDDVTDDTSYYSLDLFGALGGGYFLTNNLLLNFRGQYTFSSTQKSIPWVHNNSIAIGLRWRFINKEDKNN